jgi:nucleotide-binding universal stress UspA family protein
MKIIVWVTESTWQACVDAAPDCATPDHAAADQPEAQFVLLHVIDLDSVEAVAAARAGLLGRAISAAAPHAHQALIEAQAALLDAAEERLNRPAQRVALTGRVEQEVVTVCADADLLVLGRDGDHTRLGPRSFGHATRFVVDHAPCRVLLVWPDESPPLTSLPPLPPSAPPPRPHHPPHPPGPVH